MSLKVKFKSKYNLEHASNSILPISVGQKYHEDDKFFLTLKEIEKHFKTCTIIICDTLQRHTICFLDGYTNEHSYAVAKARGEFWRNKYEPYIQGLKLAVNFRHWDEVRQEIIFLEAEKEILKLYKNDASFRELYLKTATKLVARKKNILKTSIILAEKSCVNYLLEESAARLSWCTGEYKAQVYPSIGNLCLQEVHKRFGVSNLAPVTLKFKKTSEAKNVC